MLSASAATLMRFLITAACLVLAYIGFCQAYATAAPGRPLQYLELAYTSIQLAFGQFPEALRSRSIPLTLQVARFALPISTAWAALSLVWAQFGNRARAWRVRRKGGHLVVLGESLLAEGLIKGELDRKGRVMAWVEDASGRIARLTDAPRGSFAAGARDSLDLKKLGLESARCFVGAADVDAVNIEAAKRVIDYASTHRKPGHPLQVLARIDDLALQSALEQRLTRREERDHVELRLAAAPQLLARQFLLENPVDRLASAAGEPVRICWIGWSPLAEALLMRILAGAHFPGATRLHLIVADRDAQRIEAEFLSRRPGAREIACIEFRSLEDGASRLVADWVAAAAEAAPINLIFLTSADASTVLSTALAIETRFGQEKRVTPPLYGHLPDVSGDVPALVDDSLLCPFGSLKTLANPEALLQEGHDAIARSIHDFYLEGRLNIGESLGDRPPLAEWKDLPEAVRDENRMVADCYHFKLRSIGASIVQGAGEGLRFTADEIERLAEAEHRRWGAAKLLGGWTWGAVRDDAGKRHPDLVPYAELSEAIKDLDREQVRMIPRILGLAGQRAVRDLTVGFDGPESGAVNEAELRSALQTVSDSYPDRRIVLFGHADNELERAILLPGSRLGVAVNLVVKRPPTDIIRSAPAPDRADLAAMFRGAHTIFDLSRVSPDAIPPEPVLRLPLRPERHAQNLAAAQ